MSNNKNNNRLFDEFPPINTESWEALINDDLKGADYEKKLVWKTTDGIKLKPYYRAEDIEQLNTPDLLPGEMPYVRGNKTSGNQWAIRQDIAETNPLKANQLATEALGRGAEALALNVSECNNTRDLQNLLKDINLSDIHIHYYGAQSYLQLTEMLISAAHELGFDSQTLKGSYNFDNLGYFLAHGRFYASTDSNFVELSLLLDKTKRDLPLIKVINVNADKIHNTGGSPVQEIAYALSIGTEYLTSLTSKGQQIDDIVSRMQFTFAIGSDYFPEIAKLRAARMLWAAIVETFKPVYKTSGYMHIHSITSTWNKTIYDPYVNMLRCTTEAMSAAIGGCDSMTVLPFDLTYKNANTFSERVARNLQIILKEEAHFDKITDVSAGSYYIEQVTNALAEASWKLFTETEENGGFIKCANEGIITQNIETVAQRKMDDLATRKQILLGTNQYPNYSEKMLAQMQPKDNPELATNRREKRMSEGFEALRLSTEDYTNKGNPTPQVFLLTFGNLAMRKARAGFALNFFACAGYNITDNNGFKTVSEGVEAALKSKAQIVVLCSADEEYGTMGVEMVRSIKLQAPETQVVVAGNPSEFMEALNEAGTDTYIHVRTNVLEALQNFNLKLGI